MVAPQRRCTSVPVATPDAFREIEEEFDALTNFDAELGAARVASAVTKERRLDRAGPLSSVPDREVTYRTVRGPSQKMHSPISKVAEKADRLAAMLPPWPC